jgi:uncharacterized protein
MTPVKSPHLLLRPLEAGYFYAVNCAHPNSLRLLNQAQYNLLSAIDNQTSTVTLSDRLGMPVDSVEGFLGLLAQTEIIRFDRHFHQPQKPPSPRALNFWVHTTNQCNLSCGYCYISTLHRTGGMTEATQQQLLAKLVQTVTRRGVNHVKLRLAGGEPLTQFNAWKAFIPMARQTLSELGCALDFAFITNLTRLTDEVIDFARQHRIGFGVSLDGLAEYHDAERTFRSGKGSFAVVDTNLRRLLAQNLTVSTNTVVTNDNLAGLPELTRYLIDLDVPFRFSIVKGQAINAARLEDALTDSYATMQEAIGTGWSFTARHQFCDLKPSAPSFQTCASGFSGGAVYVDGTVNYCHVHFGDATKISHTLFDEGLDLVDMIEQGSHEEELKSADCQKCRFKSVCTSGCPVCRVGGKDPQCSLYHRFIPLIYDLQARERLKLLRDCRMI